jgi:hypothetical protein
LKVAEIARRAAGKSPAFLVRRGILEIRQRLSSPGLRRRLQSLDAAAVARGCGADRLWDVWDRQGKRPYRLDPSQRAELAALHAGEYASELDELRASVERILAHEFDLLGSGATSLGPEIDWHRDFKSGRRWDLDASERIDYAELDRDSDVKVPWELSRSQHLVTLARYWVVASDERCAAEFERQVRSWIAANPPGFGVNWACTMDVALRAVSWIWALGLFEGAPFSADFREEILLSLFQHGLWIPGHLERSEVNGNHFISDALGLVALGAVFCATRDGAAWLDEGRRILEKEIRLQVEEDGVDIEGSVPYHRLALEIFLVGERVLESAGRPVSEEYRLRLERMFDFVHAYVTPDGLSPVVGDADDGRALVLGATDRRDHRYLLSTGAALHGRPDWKARAGGFREDSLWLLGPEAKTRFDGLTLESPVERSRAFPVSGYYVLRAPGHYLFADAAPVGFRGRGGHGHNDCLSFEWHDGGPLLTDSGTFVYTASPQWRNLFRSTAFHNTIRVDGEEVNRFSPLSLFTMKDDAAPIDVRFETGAERDTLSAGHTGYRRLASPVTVRRSFAFERARPLVRLEDSLEGEGAHLVEVFFHAAPGARAHRDGNRAVRLEWDDGRRVRIVQESGPEVEWEEASGWYSPSYGVRMARPVWKAFLRARLPVRLVWLLDGERTRPSSS